MAMTERLLAATLAATGCDASAAPRSAPAPARTELAASPAREVQRLYNDYLYRLPCPEQATCGRAPPIPVSAVRCAPSAAAAEVRCAFLPAVAGPKEDQTYRCEGTFSVRDGAWRMDQFVDPCRLVHTRPRKTIRFSGAPDRRTVEEIETAYALQDRLLTVGAVPEETPAATAAVKVRDLSCSPEAGTALCFYEASRCLPGEADRNRDGWCRRRAQFHLSFWGTLVFSRGWTIDRLPSP